MCNCWPLCVVGHYRKAKFHFVLFSGVAASQITMDFSAVQYGDEILGECFVENELFMYSYLSER